MKKKRLAIGILLFAYLVVDLKADPGESSVSQFRRRNYYIDMYSGGWRGNFSFGGEMYFGEDDLLMISPKRIAPAFSISAAKDLSGLFSGRLKLTLNGHKNFYFPKDIIPFYSAGASGDVMINALKIILPFSDDFFPKLWIYVGGGTEYSFEKALHQKYEVKSTFLPSFNAGSVAEIHLQDKMDVSIEVRGTIVNEKLDGQARFSPWEGYLNVLFGLTYSFY
ncbi:MAG: hypothetical protein ACOYOT_09705 [Bacteroidales bacterium]